MRGGSVKTWTIVLAVVASACADDKDPATWVKRLDDPKRRVEAIERLETFSDHEATIEPLANAYAQGGLVTTTPARR